MTEYLTVKEIANQYKISEKTIYGWAEMGFFPTVKLNNHLLRIPREDFENWVEKRKAKGERRITNG